MIELKTNRLIIIPMAENELLHLIEKYKTIVPELSSAYQEMFDNCKKNADEFIWFIPWKICLFENKQEVGYIGFKGFNDGCPEIGYGINEEYQGKGYATEAVKALTNWAIQMPRVTVIEAETEINNNKSDNVLTKVGFIKSGVIGLEGPRYMLKK